MKPIESTWRSADGLEILARDWAPAGAARAVVCLVHGMGEHSGRYGHVAARLNRAGFAFSALDLRGHGRSGGRRGHFPDFNAAMADVGAHLSHAAARWPGARRFLYGHSLGGNLVLNYALRRHGCVGHGRLARPESHAPAAPDPRLESPRADELAGVIVTESRRADGLAGMIATESPRADELAGVIATAPLLRLAFAPSRLKIALGRLTARLLPTLSLPSGLKSEHLSRDPAVVRAYDADPLVHDRVTPGFLDVVAAGEWALAHAASFDLPLLLMHGGADRVTDPEASRRFAAAVGPTCALEIWDGLYHEIHNEPEQDDVLDTMLAWLDARC